MKHDRVAETSTTTGTGSLSLDGALTGYRGIAATLGDGNTERFLIINSADPTEWEISDCTVTDASPDTLSRDTVKSSSNSDALVDFSTGTKIVTLITDAEEYNDFPRKSETNYFDLRQIISRTGVGGSGWAVQSTDDASASILVGKDSNGNDVVRLVIFGLDGTGRGKLLFDTAERFELVGNVEISEDASGNAALDIDADASGYASINLQENGSNVWQLEKQPGSLGDLHIQRYNGSWQASSFRFFRDDTFHPEGGIRLGDHAAAANLLDDYEEGSWTITVTPATSGSVTLSSDTGLYTKVGRAVHAVIVFTVGSVSSPVGSFRISLPFSVAGHNAVGVLQTSNVAVPGSPVQAVAIAASGGSFAILQNMTDSTAWSSWDTSILAANDQFRIQITYETNE